MPQINILVPLFNEEKVFPELIERLTTIIEASNLEISVILINDGSSDLTPSLMENLSLQDHRFHSIFLSRNFGHQICLSAGLNEVDAKEAVLIIDGDLQDPPELLDQFYQELKKGYDVVYGLRENRKENVFKRISYKAFYLLLKKISYFNIPIDSGDFSMISRRVVDHLAQMPEESRFLRGMRSWIGFKQKALPYSRHSRKHGDSKYPFKALVKLAFNGIFNFSEFPIKFISRMGLTTVLVSSIYLIYTLYSRFILGETPEGFTAIIFVIVLIGGVQLISIGIIGEYILRIFFQVKKRPLYIIDKVIKNKTEHGQGLHD
jgi:glycosyltransferase involved in cell wall biosynthesis